ncbi:Beta-xylosidase [Alkalibacterium putridalgicola]|uniref:Beta-xylosidase n=1 Tax=Alkalibacterium putridalgicola TaxID=426703 RepID=A0A1H7RDA1_9LACT|nr:glycoside hydrolase 43 family protein [Alkalibacterium putridalgicola]GEK88830.1 beta-xylosidase [Alkalibacterium putridalgicola]SEL57417.1 Beta-xylosidase [Alkalibacterium putridalgicola]
MKKAKVTNPVIPLDYPDPDVIRVGEVYYMVSTTMYFFPGCEILRSIDLINWEHASFVFDSLDGTESQKLENGKNIYGQGMWAATFRYHKGTFYILFAANDTHKTYLYTSDIIEGPWKKQTVRGFYHDASLLFDEDDRVYIVYGNTDIYLTELTSDLSGPKPDGIDRCIISEKDNPNLGYEGAHVYKLNGYYYVFLIHSKPDKWMRVQACFMSNSLEGEFKGEDILIDDRGLKGQGVAQGGIVDTPDGDWYSIMFQDTGAVGRLPVLTSMSFENDFPVIGKNKKIPKEVYVDRVNDKHPYRPLVDGDDFKTLYDTPYGLKPCWQFNHEPQENGYTINTEEGLFELRNTSIECSLIQAHNTLTQRMLYPYSSAEVRVDGRLLEEGDVAGLCAFQSAYGVIALTKERDKYYVVMRSRKTENNVGDIEHGRVEVAGPVVKLKLTADFREGRDRCEFYYKTDQSYTKLGIEHHLTFTLDFFTGCRYGLFNYATQRKGGTVKFSEFTYLQ